MIFFLSLHCKTKKMGRSHSEQCIHCHEIIIYLEYRELFLSFKRRTLRITMQKKEIRYVIYNVSKYNNQ